MMNKIIWLIFFTFSIFSTSNAAIKAHKYHKKTKNRNEISTIKKDSLKFDILNVVMEDIKPLPINLDNLKKTSRVRREVPKFIEKETDGIVRTLFAHSVDNNAKDIIRKFDSLPAFGIFKDNYFLIGTDLGNVPSKSNSDVKFQLSVRQRLTKSILPFKTYVFLTFTEKAIWDVFQNSLPFRDLNYNPTIGFGRALVRDNKFLGTMLLQLEHESNGRDGLESRSWNKISLQALFKFNRYFQFQSKVWLPIGIDKQNNPDIVRYLGYGFAAVDYTSKSGRVHLGCVITKRGGYNLNANVALNCAIKMFNKANQYFFIEYYNGYGESLLDYKEYRQRIRIGFILRSDFIHLY